MSASVAEFAIVAEVLQTCPRDGFREEFVEAVKLEAERRPNFDGRESLA